jgi:multiple sugar transport system substrate-binding protein
VTDLRGITWDHVRGWGGLRAASDAYEREQGVRVTWETRSLQAFADQPIDQLGGYDLIVLDHPSVGDTVVRGALVPLDLYLDDATMREQSEGSVGRSFESYSWEGHQWALAVDAAAQVAAVRPDLLDAIGERSPTTWNGWLELGNACRRRDRWIAMPAIPVDATCSFLAACVAFGAEPFAERGRVVEPSVGREALGMLRAIIQVAHPASLTWDPPQTFAHMGAHDDVVGCPLAFGYVNHATHALAPHALRFGPVPSAPEGIPRGTLGGAGLAISSSSAAPDAACRYAAYVAGGLVQRTTYVRGGGQPGHRAAWTDPDVNVANGSFFADTLSALDAAYLRPRSAGSIAFQSRAGEVVHAYLRDGGDAAATLRALDALADEFITEQVER